MLILYILFFRMGAVTFGGGYAMLPILRREIIQNHQWMDEETIMDYYALSQGLPGIIAINVSVFIGYRRRGIPGGVAAALGMEKGRIQAAMEGCGFSPSVRGEQLTLEDFVRLSEALRECPA